MSEALKFGDTVLFLVQTKEQNGYVYSELSSSQYNFLTLFPIKTGSEKEPNFPNVKYAAFTVLAQNKYKAKQRLNYLQQHGSEADNHQIVRIMDAVVAEDAENESEQARRLGSKVSFGDTIQLQHAASNKYITVHSEAAKTESNNLLVNLTQENSEGAVFKVLPKFKVRSEGDDVRFGDEMKLESIKTQGQFLHVSAPSRTLGKAGFTVLTNYFEVNLSSNDSALTLVHHQSPSENSGDKALQAGSCVRLFHKEDECYIVAEGSFAESNPVIEDVHCRLRKVDSRKHALPSTSSNTFWQIEREGDPRNGDTLYWEESCRIKHLPTKLYLCVTKSSTNNFIVTLKERSFGKSDFDTLFSFFPLIREGDEVLFESYASIKHILTGRWLHLEKRERYVRKNFDPDAKGLAGLQWDSADLYKLCTRHSRGDYDSFALQEVQEDLLREFNYVAGIVPVLTAHIAHIQEDRMIGLTEKQSARVIATITELRRTLVTENARETKNRQKFLRNLRVLEQLAEILKSGNHDDIKKTQVAICRECYNVFKRYLEGDSRKNENYLARFIEFFQTQMSKGLNAEEVLVEIVQDNLCIISKMTETRMGQMIEQFCSSQDSRFLYFLSSLCVCSDRPIPSTQNRLLNELVLDKGKEFFLRTKVLKNEDGEKRVMYHEYKSPANKRSVRSLKPFAKPSKRMSFIGKQSFDNMDYNLLEAQLHLFGKLCKGNNANAIKKLINSEDNPEGYITFEEALMCAKDNEIDINLRLKYVELILVMFVDVGKNRPFMDNLCYSFIYDDLTAQPYADTGDDEITALTEVQNEHFCELKVWILNAIKSGKVLHYDAEMSGKNKILEETIDILGHLVRFGYYDNEDDVNETMIPLIQLLDGQTDIQSQLNKDESSVFSVKLKALEVMELFFRFKFYVKLQKFMHDFKLLNDEIVHDLPHVLETFLTFLDETHLHSKQSRVAVLTRIKHLCDGAERGGGFSPEGLNTQLNLEEVLLHLSTYDNDELVTASLGLLSDMNFFESELFEKANRAQLLVSPASIADYKKVNLILPKLRQLLRVDTDQENQDIMIKYMQTLSDLCILPMSTGVLELNSENQTMLDNFGLISDILSYILSKADDQGPLSSNSNDTAETTVREELFSVSLCLLRYLATNKFSVQKRLFNRIDDLLELKVPGSALTGVADLLTEVFTGGPELIFKITESYIERIFEIIVNSKDGIVQAHFMVTLQAMAKIEELDIPYGQNQAVIIKNFCRLRDSFCNEFLGEGEEMVEKRLNILKQGGVDDDPKQLVLMEVADLLATCAESKDQFIESVCQNIFSVEELVEIMCSNLPPKRKRPFVRFLILVYMNVDDDDSGKGASSTLSQGRTIWRYLEHLAGLLQNIATVLCAIPSEEKPYVKNQLTKSNRQRNSFSSQSPKFPGSRLPRSISTGIPNVTNHEGHVIPGLLEYLSDGIIPFLQAFYDNFFDPSEATADEMDNQYFVSAEITKSLMQLGEELSKFFTSETSLALYQSTIRKLLSFEEIMARAAIDPKKRLVLQRSFESASANVASQPKRSTLQRGGTIDNSTAHLTSTVSKDVLNGYEEQKKLNWKFNIYAGNCNTAYSGPNTASEQIDSPVLNLVYSEEGEELPLGASFQHLVALFLNTHSVGESPVVKPVAERLITQLEISNSRSEQLSESDLIRQNTLDIRCLQILRALIHNWIKLIDPELKDRNALKFRRKSTLLVVPIQNCLQDFDNAIKRVIPFLSHPNETIARETLALMKTLLFSGNETVQDGIVQSAKDTREEKLFISLRNKLEIASIQFKETKDLELQLAKRQKSKRRLASVGKIMSVEEQDRASRSPSIKSSDKNVIIEMEVISKPDKKNYDKSSDDSQALLLNLEGGEMLRKSSVYNVIDSSTDHASAESRTLLSDMLASDTSWTSLVLEVIGLMCDGQHRVLQDYLRVQPDNFRSVNVIAECCDLLLTYTADLTHNENLQELHHILQSLIETCVGNFDNQKVIFYKQVMEPIDRILQIPVEDFHKSCTSSENCPECKIMLDVIQVKGSAVELLTIMLEETNPETPSIAKGIGSSLDEDSLLIVVEEFNQWQSHNVVQKNQMDDDCQRGMFRAYHVITSLIRYQASTFNNINGIKKRYKVCNYDKEFPSECNEFTRTVEIHFEKEDTRPILTRISFPFDPSNTLREELTEQVRWNVNRDSMEDKQTSLMSLMSALKRDIIHQSKMKSSRILKPFLAFHSIRVKLLLLLTVVLNAFTLFLFKVPDRLNNVNRNLTQINEDGGDNSLFKPDAPFWFIPILFYILGPIHLIMTIVIVVEYFLINWPHFKLPQFFYTTWAKAHHLVSRDRNKPLARVYQFTLLDVNIFGITTLYTIIFLLCSILSLAFDGYFYPICLLYVISNNDILIRVLKAVTKNGISLIWVAILGIIVLFIYAVISFTLFHNDFYETDDAQLYCSTLAECMYTMMRYGLIDNIGLLVPLRSTEYNVRVQPVRLIFDLSFYIIIILIGLNIVFGIIVDTFGELREERSNIEVEQRSKCFICDLPNYEFERRGEGFKNHVKLSHNMWDYVYYSLYLDSIDTGDHTAMQKYVYELIEDQQTGFFPQEEAGSLPSDEDVTGKSLDHLQNKVEVILKKFKEKEREKSIFAKRAEQKRLEQEISKHVHDEQ